MPISAESPIRHLRSLIRFIRAPYNLQWRYRSLLSTLVNHEIKSQYTSGLYSYAWAIIAPLFTIAIYTFIFHYVLKTSFTGSSAPADRFSYALGLFIGLVQWDLFANVVIQTPASVSSKPNYVKKVVFPVEILPLVSLYMALFHYAIASLVLAVASILLAPSIFLHLYVIPLLVLPIILYSAGLGWFLSGFGVFYRDLQKAITPLLQLLYFGSAIFFPISSVPHPWQWVFRVNPVAAMVDQARNYSILGQPLDGQLIASHCAASVFVCSLGLLFFRRCKGAFADVL